MKIGIIGGGQLGQMLAISALKMGHTVIVLDPNQKCPASQYAEVIVAEYKDEMKVQELCDACDVVTYEFENVPASVVERDKIPQGFRPLALSQNRNVEKQNARNAGLLVNKTYMIQRLEDLEIASKQIGLPLLLKTASGGYDGKGQIWVDAVEEYDVLKVECIAEEIIEFDYEISVIAIRGFDGSVVTLPVPRNIHKNNILHMSVVPNEDEFVNTLAKNYAKQLLVNSEIYGICAIEFFVKGDQVYFNEMAPRPHNSGHYSIEGCDFSQFDLALKAILKEELPEPSLLQPTIMVNYLGQHVDQIKHCNEGVIHDYGKEEARKNRKMGHITFINKTEAEVTKIWEELTGESE